MSPARRYVGFVRNVTIGRDGLTADRLVDVVTGLGATEARSHFAAGNVAFVWSGPARPLHRLLTGAVSSVLGRTEEVFVRSLDHLAGEVARAPHAPHLEGVHERLVTFTELPADRITLPLATPKGDVVVVASCRGDVYSVRRLVDGSAGLPNQLVERSWRCRASTRKWDTVERLVALYG